MFACFTIDVQERYFTRARGSILASVDSSMRKSAARDEYAQQKAEALRLLRQHLAPTGSMDAGILRDGWFPSLTRDVFISHAHKDEHLAIMLSEWLHSTFGLTAFVDSTVWGHAAQLLKEIDNYYCINADSPKAAPTYDYNKRNGTTSHVHTILATALTSMIDCTECLLFLNTPQSLSAAEAAAEAATYSPWIYHEVSSAAVIRERSREDHRAEKRAGRPDGQVHAEHRDLQIYYRLTTPLSRFIPLGAQQLDAWVENWTAKPRGSALDSLYALFASRLPRENAL